MAKQDKETYESYAKDMFDNPPAGPMGVHRGARSMASRALPYVIVVIVALLAGLLFWGVYSGEISNMVECKSRGAYLMGLTTYGNYSIEDTADFVVYIPKTDEHFEASLAVIPLQLMGYYVSVAKGLDVDKPRNLAKSVTVE